MSTMTSLDLSLVEKLFRVLHFEADGEISFPHLYPIRADGRLIMTDGRICFDFPDMPVARYRELVNGQWAFTPESNCRPYLGDFRDIFKNVDFTPTYSVPEIKPPKCVIDWHWTSKGPCDECHGNGEVFCDYHHYHPCPDCDGTGIVFDMHEDARSPTFIDGVPLGTRYLWLVSQLPNAILGPVKDREHIGFSFDGGKGVLCRMRD